MCLCSYTLFPFFSFSLKMPLFTVLGSGIVVELGRNDSRR